VAVLYRAGWTRTQLAGRYRTTPGTIRHRLEQEGVTWRKNRLPAPRAARDARLLHGSHRAPGPDPDAVKPGTPPGAPLAANFSC
jgi:hypothetical protein